MSETKKKKAATRLSNTTVAQIRELSRVGWSVTVIAERLKLDRKRVWAVVNRRGAYSDEADESRSVRQELIEKAERLKRDGMNHSAIARELGVPRPTVLWWLRHLRNKASTEE